VSCANCERLELRCSFEFMTPMTFPRLSRGTLGTKDSRTVCMTSFNPSRGLSPSGFDTQTSELFHHFRSALYDSLAENCPPSVWCVNIPQLGLEYPFVINGFLSISALHLASMVPQRSQELQILALAQSSLAMPSFRSLIKSPNSENIHALWIFSGAIVFYTMALPDMFDRCRLPCRNDKRPHWFQITRGFMDFLGNNWLELKEGPLGALIHGRYNDRDYAPENPNDEQFAKLQEMFSPNKSSSTQLSERSVEIYTATLEDLRQVAGRFYLPSVINDSPLRYWAGSLRDEFAELLYDRDPRALVILAYYCVLLKRANHFWYLRDLGSGLLENIRKALPKEWLPWIEWALEQPVSMPE
jgi:hypothetical protein